jgi:hypothetical protein
MKRQKISPEVLFGEGAKQNWKETRDDREFPRVN